jgi:OmcA/MtrC family decaheme c-type cytochrome
MVACYLITLAAVTLSPTSNLTHTGTITQDVHYPGRLAPAPGGGVYVTDPPMKQVVQYDAAGAVVGIHAITQVPIGIGVHPSGNLFISRQDEAIGIYDASFALVGTLNPAPFTMTAPNDIAVHPTTGEVYVTDSEAMRVLVFNGTTGALARMWGTAGSGLSQFQSPQALAIDAARDRVIVSDVDNFRVQVFNTAGVLQFKFGYRTLYVGSSQVAWLARTEGVAVDGCGNIYLSDALMGTIRVFDATGKEIDPGYLPPVTYGTGVGQVRIPCDVLVAGTKLFVASTNNAAVEVYSVACTQLRGAGNGRGGVSSTATVAVADPVGEVSAAAERRPAYVDNPLDIVQAMNAGTYSRDLDLNRDQKVDQADLDMAVAHFGGATVQDFLNAGNGLRDTYPYPLQPPHMPNIPNICGRCHSMDGAPAGGMLTSAGQENLCLSCHTASGRAMGAPIGGAENANSHPWGVAANTNGVNGPAAGSELALHLDNGDIRCATCHNPHESPVAGATYLRGSATDGSLCGQCHRETAEWQKAGHADPQGEAWKHYDWTQSSRAACRRCHSGNGFIDFSNGVPEAQQRGAFRVLDCVTCHATHGRPQEDELLRVYDTVTLPANGPDVTVTGVGAMATCMACHNGRVAPEDAGITPHYLIGGVMLEGLNGITFGYTLENSPHQTLATCVDCHMGPSPAAGQPGAGKVGGHTFNVKVNDAADPEFGFENVAACNTAACHGNTGRSPELLLTTLNRTAFGDYDGDGTIEGVQDETHGLADLVLAQILAKGAVKLDAYPYWVTTGVPAAQKALVEDAIWNWQYNYNSGDYGVHNTAYAVGLLQVTYKALTGVDVPNAFLRYSTPVTSLAKTVVAITSVNGGAPVQPGAAFSVNFTVKDDAGVAIPKASLNRLRIYVAGPSTNYQLVITVDSNLANFTQNPDGSFTYTRPTPFPTVYAAPLNDSPAFGTADGELTGQPLLDGTYTALIEARRAFGTVQKAGDATLDFIVANVPGSPPAPAPRQVVMRDVCNNCHNDLQVHGGNRLAVTGCVVCHTAGAEDAISTPASTPGRTINFNDMIHRLHRGSDLPQVKATANSADPYHYNISGFGASLVDFSDVGFPVIPAGVMDCDACHAGAAQAGNIYTKITRARCATCHDDLNFTLGTVLDTANPSVSGGLLTQADLSNTAYRVAPGGITHAFVDDTSCAACHGVGGFADIQVAHRHPTDPAAGGTQPVIEIVSVTGATGGGGAYFQAGDKPQIKFKVRNNTTNPLQLVSGNKAVMDRVEFIIGGPTNLYQTLIPSVRAWNNGALGVPTANWIDNFAVDGTYTYISTTALPANYPKQTSSATPKYTFEGGWGQLYTAAGTPLEAGTYTVFAYGRRLIPPALTEREPALSDTFDFVVGAANPIVPYAATVETASCNACHGNLAFHGNAREGVVTCMGCHTAGNQIGTTAVESIDLRVMVHKIHNARNLDVVAQGGQYLLGTGDFSQMLISSMPGEAAECHVCHSTDAWKNPPVRDNMRTWMVACTSCHDAAETATHVGAATGDGFKESCASCHGEGTPWSVERVHKTP